MIPLVARRELWPSLAGPTGAKLCVHDHGLAWEIGRERSPHGQFGTHLSRGAIYYIAYRWNGREYRESTRSTERRVAERLLASRVADGRGRGHHGPLTFDHLAAWYLDDYLVRRLRTVDTARGCVANLRATFGGQPATVMTTEAIRSYQRTGLAAGAAAATVNRETSALSRMLQLAIRAGALDHRSVFPERLEERGPRQGFFEHADYEAVRRGVAADAARLATGVGGSPFTGRVSHPLDGEQSFMTSPHRHSPLTSLAWSHRATTPCTGGTVASRTESLGRSRRGRTSANSSGADRPAEPLHIVYTA